MSDVNWSGGKRKKNRYATMGSGSPEQRIDPRNTLLPWMKPKAVRS